MGAVLPLRAEPAAAGWSAAAPAGGPARPGRPRCGVLLARGRPLAGPARPGLLRQARAGGRISRVAVDLLSVMKWKPGAPSASRRAAQAGGLVDADLPYGRLVVADRAQPLGQLRRERRPGQLHRALDRPQLVTGMIPAMIGTSQPSAATRSRSRR